MADRWSIACPRFGFGVLDKLKHLGNAALVEPSAPHAARKAVETCARYFQREFRYDMVQYSAEHPGSTRALLWTEYDPVDIEINASVWSAPAHSLKQRTSGRKQAGG